MKTTEIVVDRVLTDVHLTQLADQMDPSIGEATSVVGAMVQEIIRRSLRGGVLSIGRELDGYVTEQVSRQIVAQTPVIERTAAATALARATEVVQENMAAIEQAARDGDEMLAEQIVETARLAAEAKEKLAQEVSQRFEVVARQSEEATQQLTCRIEDAAQTLTQRLEISVQASEQAQEQLVGRIDDTARQATEATASLARTLAEDITAAEQRALDTARTEFKTQIEEVRERARKATSAIRERLDKLEGSASDLAALQESLRRDLLDAVAEARGELVGELKSLRLAHRRLLERVEALERPRGIRGFFSRLFGRKKSPVAQVSDDSDEGDERVTER